MYPPQELGGYGRSMADFAWGFLQRGHQVTVLTSDAPYLHADACLPSDVGPNGEVVDRRLQLKGSYQRGVTLMTDLAQCLSVDRANQFVVRSIMEQSWDGVVVGNIDCLGPELLGMLLQGSIPILHHIGFMDPPFLLQQWPSSSQYIPVAASHAVRSNLQRHGLPVAHAPVVYPGVRSELFGDSNRPLTPALRFAQRLQSVGLPLGSKTNPLKVGFAGLLMGTKGVHTLAEALVILHQQGIAVQACFAGAEFQLGYLQTLQQYLDHAGMHGLVHFVGQLSRSALSRFWNLHHIGVFTSIYPEAFGIVAAEVMAAGATLVSSAVGGAAELVPSDLTGRRYTPGEASELASVLRCLVRDPQVLFECAQQGQSLVRSRFDVLASVVQLEQLVLQQRK
ncbi:glycosyltransferase family 4 protein [Synechococcus sp. A15-60]|uniref:glycosyltransferase family 4 protein n=1 Tax=Synechococcus sp. A15-60 TaxID=1050655 RepID=UPI00164646AF|nr:glycosyltransferase family 4 protein [Synechococcus sp. A15-60]QNI46824.1 glycosyl transferases group 1 family protein [Synechococcus sp. A15-60]